MSKAGLDHLARILAAGSGNINIQVNRLDPSVMDVSMQDEVKVMGTAV